MDFTQLVSEVAAKTQMSKAQSEIVLHDIFEAVSRRLQEGGLIPVTEGMFVDWKDQLASYNILTFKRGNQVNQHAFIDELRSQEDITKEEATFARYVFNQTKTNQIIMIDLTDIAHHLNMEMNEAVKVANRLIDKNILHTLDYYEPVERVCLGARWRKYL
ncbi:hypothetical protein [Bacillus sp. CGMCC 1.16541]|uniref:HU family DNA-binding protein n=1 Tax=Bacillus sp. CGMCC 1.16541 TaxID=2185143 RepID=UPI000D73AEE5|nr:hypothetical protein [Bacillus sp. CGMCC 1.16541]